MILTCTIDETAQGQVDAAETLLAELSQKQGVRTLILDSYDLGSMFYDLDIRKRSLMGSAAPAFFYGSLHPARRRRTPVNVDKMVDLWATVIPKLALAHDKDALDAAEAQIDELLTPMLAAPVKQLRDFFGKLVDRLKNDPAVPFMIWRAYETWHEKVITPAADESIKRLKHDLAEEVVNLVDPAQPDIQADIRESMIRALMWRDPQKLEEVKEALTEAKGKGIRPQVKGRQSCLFLQVPREGAKPAEIML